MSLWLFFGKSNTEFPFRVVSVCPNCFFSVLFFLATSGFGRFATAASGIMLIEKGSTTISTMAPTGSSSPFRWGAQAGGGFNLASRGSLSQQFRFPVQIEGTALARYESIAFGARVGMAFGSSVTESAQAGAAWNPGTRAELMYGNLVCTARLLRYKKLSVWPWGGLGLSAIDLYPRFNASPVHSGFRLFFPAGLMVKYDLSIPVPGNDLAPVSLFLQYQYQEHAAFRSRAGFHQLGAGIWFQFGHQD
jgi:hypothetical protein